MFPHAVIVVGLLMVCTGAYTDEQQSLLPQTSRNFTDGRHKLNVYRLQTHRIRRQASEWHCQFQISRIVARKDLNVYGLNCSNNVVLKNVSAYLLEWSAECPTCICSSLLAVMADSDFSFKGNELKILFHNVIPGNYCLRVTPQPSEDFISHFLKLEFNDYVTEPVIIDTANNSSYGKFTVYFACIGVFIGISCIACIGIILRKSRNDPDQTMSFQQEELHGDKDLVKKKVFIIYSIDCALHKNVVLLLAEIMEKYFSCKVAAQNDEDLDDIQENRAMYIIRNLNSSDVIILVNSEGACYRFLALQDKQILGHGSVDDIFCEALNSLSHDSQKRFDYRKTVNVRFEYTGLQHIPNHFIVPNKHFELPGQMQELFCHIHGLDPVSGADIFSECGYYQSDLHEQLISAVDQTREYLRQNPNFIKNNTASLHINNI